MSIESEAGEYERIELAGQEIGEIERSKLLVLHGGIDARSGIELVAMSARDALHAFALEHGIECSAGSAIRVRDEDPNVVAERPARLVDPVRDRAGDPTRSHVQASVHAVDLDAGEVPGQHQQLARERATADDDDSGRLWRH